MLDIERTQKLFAEHNIKFFMMSFVDMHGTPRAKLVPAECLADVVDGAAGFAGFAVDGLGQGPHDPDLSCVPTASSTVFPIPWKPGLAWIAGNMKMGGDDWSYCPRTILSRGMAEARSRGFNLMLGVEPEFFLIDKLADGSFRVADHGDTLAKPCYGQLALMRRADFLTTLMAYMNDLGYGVYQNDHEDANGQFELNWRYSDALTTSDRVSFFKFMVKALAEQQGLHATFMPKPFSDLTGNGAHMHLSLFDADGADNLFLDKSDPLGLSSIAWAFMGGILAHAEGLCALTSPSVNSYKRFGARSPRSGATWAPAFIAHSGNNRTAMIRVPAPGRFEYRTADSSCNPYLAAAGILAAGLDGIERKLSPGNASEGNLFLLSPQQGEAQGLKMIPRDLGEALDAFEKDDVLREALGEDYSNAYIEAKREEFDSYLSATAGKISEWEMVRYLEV